MRVSELLFRARRSPSLWDQLFAVDNGDWGSTWWGKLVQILIILLIAIVVRAVAHTAIRILVNRVVTGAKKKRQRIEDTQALLASR